MNDSKFRLERVRAPVSNEELIADIRRVADLEGTECHLLQAVSKIGKLRSDNCGAAIRHLE